MCTGCYSKYPIKCPLCTLPREGLLEIVTGETLYSALKLRWKEMGFDIKIDHVEKFSLNLLEYLKVCPLESNDINGIEKMLDVCPFVVGFHMVSRNEAFVTVIHGHQLKGVFVLFKHESGYLSVFFL